MWSPSTWLSVAFAILHATVSVYARETVEEAAVFARQLVKSASIGTMATVYPANHAALSGEPFSLQEYYASCHENGSLTLLFLPISRHSQNILLSPGHSASISVWSDRPAANRPRVSLIGNVTLFPVVNHTPKRDTIQECYLVQHPDARWWLPGPREPHTVYWARFDPHSVYYVGGFGNEHFIGYIPLEMYQTALLADHGADTPFGGRLLVTQE